MPAPPPVHAGAMSVPVNGGDLVVSRLSSAAPSAPTAIALHGITGNGWAWLPVAAGLFGRMSLWAPDLRGRAASRLVGPPYGLGTHADDVIALMDHLELERAVLIGHSMGHGWVRLSPLAIRTGCRRSSSSTVGLAPRCRVGLTPTCSCMPC